MNSKEIMLNILKNRNYYKQFFITQRQIDIVNFVINSWKCKSNDVADAFDISIQSASTQLKRLAEIGYLDRTEISSDSGGIEFEYRCAIKDRPANTLSNARARL